MSNELIRDNASWFAKKRLSLGRAARDDIAELENEYAQADDEDKEEIVSTIVELLLNIPAEVADPDEVPEGMSPAEFKSGRKAITQARTAYSKWLRKERKKHGWTQHKLARRADLTQSHVSRIEGGLHYPQESTRNRIEKAFE